MFEPGALFAFFNLGAQELVILLLLLVVVVVGPFRLVRFLLWAGVLGLLLWCRAPGEITPDGGAKQARPAAAPSEDSYPNGSAGADQPPDA